MKHEDIIRMAREAGWPSMAIDNLPGTQDMSRLERFAALVAAAEREACSRVKAAKPRKLTPVGAGTLWSEQQYCFEKGWREGAASVRATIRARSKP